MVGILDGVLGKSDQVSVRDQAIKALKDSDLTQVFEAAGMLEGHELAGAALKTVLAEKLAEYTIKAMKEAKKRGMKVGAAAVILAAKG